MKRPNGFDRAQEPPEPEHPGARERKVRDRRFWERTPREPRAADSGPPERHDAEPGAFAPSPAASGASDPEPPASPLPGEAETIDLSEVRAARESESDSYDTVQLAEDGRSGGRSGGVLARLRSEREPDPVRLAERRVRAARRERRAQERRERRRFSVEARRRRRNWFIVLGTVGALVVFVAAGVFTPLMAVRNVQVVGATSVNVADIEQALARFDGVPLALVNEGDVHRALEPFPLIQRYAIELIPPDTLTVRIEERLPVLSIEQDGVFVLYDAAGVLLGTADAPVGGVPVASGGITDLTSDAFAAAARVLRDMPAELRAQVGSVVASSGQDVTLGLTSGVQVLWGDAEETRRKAVVLTSMMAALGDRAIEQIDVSSSGAPVFR